MTHYFDPKPQVTERTRRVTYIWQGQQLSFDTNSGMFSPRKVDTGSKVLAEYASIPKNAHVLDLGCAWGFVGILVALRHPDCNVTMTDINTRAVQYAKKNALRHQITAHIHVSDGFSALKEQTYDVILFNPPFSAGKAIWVPLIEKTYTHLKNGGSLQVVARHQKGGKSVEEILKRCFFSVTHLKTKSGFRVYMATR